MATVLAGGGTTMTAQTINPYAYAHSQPTRFTDPSGKWVDEYGKWHPCNLLTETASCIGQLPGWFTSNDIPKFGRYAKGVGKSVIKNLDPLNLGALFTQLQTDPIGTAVAMSHMPTDMAKSMIDALRNCDYEAMGELSADIGLTLYGGAELGVGLVDMAVPKPSISSPDAVVILSSVDEGQTPISSQPKGVYRHLNSVENTPMSKPIKLGHDFTLNNSTPGYNYNHWHEQGIVSLTKIRFWDMFDEAVANSSSISFNIDGIDPASTVWHKNYYTANPSRYTYQELDTVITSYSNKTTFYRGQQALSPTETSAFIEAWKKLRSQ